MVRTRTTHSTTVQAAIALIHVGQGAPIKTAAGARHKLTDTMYSCRGKGRDPAFIVSDEVFVG